MNRQSRRIWASNKGQKAIKRTPELHWKFRCGFFFGRVITNAKITTPKAKLIPLGFRFYLGFYWG